MAFVKLLLTGDATTEVQNEATLDLTGDVTISGSGKFLTANDFGVGPKSTLTISTGDVTITGSHHEIDGGGSGADLDGMSAGRDGQILFIRPQDDTETIVVKHNQHAAATNNILLDANTDYSMDDIDDYMFLIYDVNLDSNGAWIEISRGSGAAVAVLTANAPSDVGTTAVLGNGTEAAIDNHVHDTAIGFIDNNDKFVAAIIENSALADNAVDSAEINTNAVGADAIDTAAEDILFSQIVLNPKTDGSGTTVGTLFYDSDDDHLYVFVT